MIEPATLINLGFEWFIQGDNNRTAAVEVSYRKAGTTAWKPALPLLRLQGERIYAESRVDVIAPNMFAGSILDLEPDTAYEARFVMSNPDGVRGPSERVVTVRTRAPSRRHAGGRVFHVYPHGFKGQKVEPSFEGADVHTTTGAPARIGRRRGASGRETRSSCTLGRIAITATIHEQRQRQSHGAARRHVLPDCGRHA